MADIQLRSYQSILGAMAAQLLGSTDLTDLNPGGVLLTLLEAAAASDFSLEAKLVQLLNVRNIDKAIGIDLEGLAIEMGVSPGRIGASAASATLSVQDSAFTKISSNIYAGATAPTAGDSVVKLVSAASFSSSGTIYIGRGTATSESINYVSATNSGSYWTLQLSSHLTKNHLVGEEVVLSQGGDRAIPARQVVRVPAFGGSPAISFSILSSYKLADGEDTITGVLAAAIDPGSVSNVGRHKIIEFQGTPWSTATITNEDPSTGGRDAETDPEIRQRVKDFVHDLGRGTERAIIRAVVGISDSEENKRVISAFLRHSTDPTKPAILFIDDGNGFAPIFSGIGQEVIVTSAVGTETFFQLQKWPLVKSQAASVGVEPFALTGGESLYVEIDGQVEEFEIPSIYYRTPGVVLAQEVAEAINKVYTTVEARAKDGQLFLTPVAEDPDYIRVGAATLSPTDMNTALRCPTRKQYSIRLYKNDKLLDKSGATAQVQSLQNSKWTGLTSSETLQLTVDKIDSPVITVTNLDFATLTSSITITGATVSDWVTVINAKFIGVTATARDDGTYIISSNRGRDIKAAIAIKSGSLATKLFPANSSSQGKASDYKVNRLLGQIELSARLSAGDELKAGTVNTRGFAITGAQTSFDLNATNGLAAQMVLIADAPYTKVLVAQSGTIAFSSSSSGVQRITSGTVGQFANVAINDCLHLYNLPRSGILRVIAVRSDGTNPDYIDCSDPEPVSASAVTLDGITNNLNFFRTEGLPQLVTLPIGTTVSNSVVQSSIQNQVMGITVDLLETQAIRIRTDRFSGDGALAIPSVVGSAKSLGILAANYVSEDPHVAAVESSDLLGIGTKKIQSAMDDTVFPYVNLDANAAPFTQSIDSNRPILTYLGANEQKIRQPAIRLDSANLILRAETPSQIEPIGQDMSAVQVSGLEFGQNDNMVFLLDSSPATKTFDVPMYVEATVAGPTVPSALQFDLADNTNSLLGVSDRWAGHRFEDYRVWFRAKGVLPSSTANSAVRITAVPFGPNGKNIRAGIVYPTTPNSEASASLSLDTANDQIVVSIALKSGNQRPITLNPNQPVQMSVSGSGPYTQKLSFIQPVDLTQVQIGDLVSVSDANASALNQTVLKVSALNHLIDLPNSFRFLADSLTVDVVASVQITLDSSPSEPLQVGDKITIGSVSALVQTVADATHCTVATSLPNGSAQAATLTHKAVTATSAPTFTAQTGDKIQVGSTTLTVTGIVSPIEFQVDQPFAFTGTITGVLTRIQLIAQRSVAGPNETFNTSGSNTIRVFEIKASDNLTSALITAVNGTAGVLDVVTASNIAGSSGSGSITKSTLDELGTGAAYVALQNGESFVYSTGATSPGIRLKEVANVTPEIGDVVRLIPMTPTNVRDHFSKKQITGLTVAAGVALVDRGRRVQVSSLTPGGLGQVFAVGGRASGLNVLDIRGTAQKISSSRAIIELDKSSAELLSPGHTIRLSQTGRARKLYPAAQPSSSTTVLIEIPVVGQGRLTFGTPLVNIFPYSQVGTTKWAVRKIGRSRVRFQLIAGSTAVPSGIQTDDWVLVGDSSSYAGITTDRPFAPANQGWFQVRETDNASYFDIDNSIAVEEFVISTNSSLIFTSYHSVRPGDQIVLGSDSPVSTANKGTYLVLSVPSTAQAIYSNANTVSEGPFTLGSSINSVGVLDQGYSTYRQVAMVAPKPTDPTNRAVVTLTPGYDISLLSEGQLAKVTLPCRLGYGTDPVPGVSAYQYWTGLKRKAQRVVDGYEPDSATFQGVGAAGVKIEVREPQIQRVALALKVKTSKGVSLQSISDTIKSNVAGYVNSLGLGQDVVMSEVVSLVQQVPGVDAVVLSFPIPGTERITVTSNSIARISSNNITLS